FHRRAVAVDGGRVEERAELVLRLLRRLADEGLATETHDRLFGRAVTVVRVALAVQVDEALVVLLRPEDVVREEAVTVVGSLLGNLGRANGSVPYERRDVVERARRRGEAVERRAELALEVDDVFAPQAVQQLVVLDRQRQALADVLTEPGVDGARVATAHHEVHAAA